MIGAKEAGTRSFAEGREISEAKLKEKDDSWLQPVCGQYVKNQDLVTPSVLVPRKQVGITVRNAFTNFFISCSTDWHYQKAAFLSNCHSLNIEYTCI